MIQMGEYQNAERAILAFSKLLRKSFANSQKIITLQEELSMTEEYLQLMQFRYPEGFRWNITIAPGVEKLGILKNVVQPLVENAIHHGRRNEEEILHIIVRVLPEGDKVCFQVSDDGNGIEPEKLMTLRKELDNYEEGYGLKNVDNRVKLTYGETYGVEIDSSYGVGTTVQVFIPQITK